jgi:hypothetical protein
MIFINTATKSTYSGHNRYKGYPVHPEDNLVLLPWESGSTSILARSLSSDFLLYHPIYIDDFEGQKVPFFRRGF